MQGLVKVIVNQRVCFGWFSMSMLLLPPVPRGSLDSYGNPHQENETQQSTAEPRSYLEKKTHRAT